LGHRLESAVPEQNGGFIKVLYKEPNINCSSTELIVSTSHRRGDGRPQGGANEIYHEIPDGSVKDCPVVVAFLTELDEIFTRLGHHVAMQFKIQRSQIGDHPHVACAYGIQIKEISEFRSSFRQERNVKVHLSS
jgi:hypothetical protein